MILFFFNHTTTKTLTALNH